jgi:hypothetical protein
MRKIKNQNRKQNRKAAKVQNKKNDGTKQN